MFRHEFFVRCDFVVGPAALEISHLADEHGVGAVGQIGRVLVPGDRILDVLLLFVEGTEPSREIHTLRLCLVPPVSLFNLLVERFASERNSALLLQRRRDLLVLDQVAITFRLRPAAGFH